MTAIITVVGRDMVGIIASVSQTLAQTGVNIESISQTILEEYFTMMMKVDLAKLNVERPVLNEKLHEVGRQFGVQVNLIHEDVLKAMHRI